jgi:PD-(D/E)XK nuclease superfamily
MIRQTREMTPKNAVPDLIFKDECYAIIGACFEVYKDKGCGFHEPVYQECLGIEFEHCGIPAIAQPALSLDYRDRILELIDEHRSQVLNYLKAGSFKLGLLINFGHYPKLEYERMAKTQPKIESDEAIFL